MNHFQSLCALMWLMVPVSMVLVRVVHSFLCDL